MGDDCYWDSLRCREPLVRVTVGNDTVLGIDTGSAYTVLTTDTCGIELGPGQALQSWADADCAARDGLEQCRLAEHCEWSAAGQCGADTDVLLYVSGEVGVVDWPATFAAEHLHEGMAVPLCSEELFPQNDDGLVGMMPAAPGDDREEHSLMRHILDDDHEDHVVVLDRQLGTVCVGKHCVRRPPGASGVEERPKIHRSYPLVQHSPRQRLMLDTGTTLTSNLRLGALGEVCQVGALDIEYLEVLRDTVRYSLSKSALDSCRPP